MNMVPYNSYGINFISSFHTKIVEDRLTIFFNVFILK